MQVSEPGDTTVFNDFRLAFVQEINYQGPVAQFEARVPAHAQNDHLSVEVPSFEQIFDRDESLHLFIIARHPRVCTRAISATWLITAPGCLPHCLLCPRAGCRALGIWIGATRRRQTVLPHQRLLEGTL